MSLLASAAPIAHVAAQHWSEYLIYAMPFSMVAIAIIVTTMRERREERAKEEQRQEAERTRPRR